MQIMNFNLYGSENSAFLKAVRRKAIKRGIPCEITMNYKPLVFYVCDWETFPDCDKLPVGVNLDYPQPAVVQSVLELLDEEHFNLEGKNVLVIGKGRATRGLPEELLSRGATVTVAHSKTVGFSKLILVSDIIINAAPSFNLNRHEEIMGLKEVIDFVGYARPGHFGHFIDANTVGSRTTSILVDRMEKIWDNLSN